MRKYILAASAAALWCPTFATARTAFAGPRVQLDLAYDQLDANDDYPDLPRHLDTAYLGATIGYDHAVADGVILGGEIGFGKPLGGRERATLGEDAVSVKPGREWTVGVRLGTIVTGSTLAFATAGYSNAGLNATYESPITSTGERTRYDASKGGLLWGFGVEQAIGGRAFASLAFRSAQVRLSSPLRTGSIASGPGAFWIAAANRGLHAKDPAASNVARITPRKLPGLCVIVMISCVAAPATAARQLDERVCWPTHPTVIPP